MYVYLYFNCKIVFFHYFFSYWQFNPILTTYFMILHNMNTDFILFLKHKIIFIEFLNFEEHEL